LPPVAFLEVLALPFSCVCPYTAKCVSGAHGPVLHPGVQLCEAGRAVLRREPWHGHQATHRPVQAYQGKTSHVHGKNCFWLTTSPINL
jgi:hypothetical protein